MQLVTNLLNCVLRLEQYETVIILSITILMMAIIVLMVFIIINFITPGCKSSNQSNKRLPIRLKYDLFTFLFFLMHLSVCIHQVSWVDEVSWAAAADCLRAADLGAGVWHAEELEGRQWQWGLNNNNNTVITAQSLDHHPSHVFKTRAVCVSFCQSAHSSSWTGSSGRSLVWQRSSAWWGMSTSSSLTPQTSP